MLGRVPSCLIFCRQVSNSTRCRDLRIRCADFVFPVTLSRVDAFVAYWFGLSGRVTVVRRCWVSRSVRHCLLQVCGIFHLKETLFVKNRTRTTEILGRRLQWQKQAAILPKVKTPNTRFTVELKTARCRRQPGGKILVDLLGSQQLLTCWLNNFTDCSMTGN